MVNYEPDETGYLKVETHRSGHFIFQIGLDFEELDILKDRVNDAHIRLTSLPFASEISSQLEKRVMISSIYSTNTIEGGELSYQETADILNLADDDIKEQREQRVNNLKNAYNFSEQTASLICFKGETGLKKKGKLFLIGNVILQLSEEIFKSLHEAITLGLKHEFNQPRLYRDNHKGQKTTVGHADVGGIYQPPKCKDDIQMLMQAFCCWANSEPVQNLPTLYRAALIHYYFELIHPFWDGNGRTGRLAEATILRASGYEYAPHAMSRYYLDKKDIYFSLLNSCRKNAKKAKEKPYTPFVYFFLRGMLKTINRLHDRANSLIADILMQSRLEHLIINKTITVRQHNVLSNLIANENIRSKEVLKTQAWYKALYLKLTERTAMRDLKKLADLKLIKIADNGDIKIAILRSKVQLADHPHAN